MTITSTINQCQMLNEPILLSLILQSGGTNRAGGHRSDALMKMIHRRYHCSWKPSGLK
ncbi:hypothetical protein predicted by Glimmer/Critica [Azoarcus olearius]|uniref:Uncharacterized protein n=1 Tax=Azoarcus sp. (strain BH72) TaxID=418699 RepID=A1KAV1_AZOSB|nr:hypothetical protein predicted by Glimmer/Critica [Azoarcus olearius]